MNGVFSGRRCGTDSHLREPPTAILPCPGCGAARKPATASHPSPVRPENAACERAFGAARCVAHALAPEDTREAAIGADIGPIAEVDRRTCIRCSRACSLF